MLSEMFSEVETQLLPLGLLQTKYLFCSLIFLPPFYWQSLLAEFLTRQEGEGKTVCVSLCLANDIGGVGCGGVKLGQCWQLSINCQIATLTTNQG